MYFSAGDLIAMFTTRRSRTKRACCLLLSAFFVRGGEKRTVERIGVPLDALTSSEIQFKNVVSD
jgi:hypothetical protein